MLWLVAASFLALAAAMVIVFVTSSILVSSTAATNIALAGDSLFFGISWHRQQQLLLCWLLAASFLALVVAMAIASLTGHLSPLSGINGSNFYSCFGWWQAAANTNPLGWR